MNWFRVLLAVLLMLVMLLFASPVAYAADPPDEDPEMKVDIGIDGDLKVDIDASGHSELSVGVEGPSEVDIDAGDEVDLNVEASEESKVFIKGQNPDEPAGDQESGDNDPAGDLDNQSLNLQDRTWKWNPYVAIISVAFPVLGVLAFVIAGLL